MGFRLFLLGLGLLFLGFEFVADELEDGDFGVVANTVTGMDDAGIATGAVGEFRRDFTEELLGDRGREDVGGGLAARMPAYRAFRG